MTDDIVHEATFPHDVGDVWRALTTRDALGAWLMENDLDEAVVGRTFYFRDKPKKIVGWDGVTQCKILEATPPSRLVWAFGDPNEMPTRVTFDLEPTPEGGTRLRFRHSGFTGFKGWLMRQGMKQGWGGMVRHSIPFVVARMLEGRIPAREETREVRKRGLREEHAAPHGRA